MKTEVNKISTFPQYHPDCPSRKQARSFRNPHSNLKAQRAETPTPGILKVISTNGNASNTRMPIPASCRPQSFPTPTQRLGTRLGLAPSLRPRNQGAAGDPLPPPGRSPAVPAQKRTPRSAQDLLARSPRPLGRPVTLTGGLPGSGLRPVTRPRPHRRERLPRAGTGSRAGQVGVSTAPRPPDPVLPG